MRLSSLFLHLDGRCFAPELCLKLKDRSRPITYRIQRMLKGLKVPMDGFNRIVIEPSLAPTHTIFVNSAQVASITVAFDADRFAQASDEALNLYCVALIRDGLTRFHQQIPIPLDAMLAAMDELAAQGFVDEWVHQDKLFRQLDTRARLTCRMDAQAFRLRLTLSRQGAVFHDEVILTTPPDEIAFHHRFKDLVARDRAIAVTARTPRDGLLVTVPV